MIGEALLRFAIGGVVVSLFAVVAELFEPKTFSGLFGAAPSVALGTLTITYLTAGSGEAAIAARWMLIATPALFAYSTSCLIAARHPKMPIWIAAAAAWLVWLAVAGALWLTFRWTGLT
jgi:hypothetical protein